MQIYSSVCIPVTTYIAIYISSSVSIFPATYYPAIQVSHCICVCFNSYHLDYLTPKAHTSLR